MRHIPIFTFINKMDREAKDTFDLLDDIEKVLGIETCPINWPIGCGKEFKGVYERASRNILRFEAVSTGGAKEAKETIISADDDNAADLIGEDFYENLMEEIELLDGAAADLQRTAATGLRGHIR